jgi:hypothetical protein
MRKNRPQSKQRSKPSKRRAVSQALPRSLTAKEILKKVFGCAGPLTDDEVLERVRAQLASGSGKHFNALPVNAWLIGSIAGQFVERVWIDFQALDESVKCEVAVTLRARLKKYAKSRSGGRPKGAKGQGIEQLISLAAALQLLSCLRTRMVPFLYPKQHREEAGKQAVDKLFKRHADWIQQEHIDMKEALALKIVKAHVTVESAERIVKLNL